MAFFGEREGRGREVEVRGLALVLGAGDDLPPAKLGVALDLGLRPREVRARLVELRLRLAVVERRENGALLDVGPALDAYARDLPVALGGDVGGLVGGESARHLEDARQNAALDGRAVHGDRRRRRPRRRGVRARPARAAGGGERGQRGRENRGEFRSGHVHFPPSAFTAGASSRISMRRSSRSVPDARAKSVSALR